MHLVPCRNYKPSLSLGSESCLHLLLILKANPCVGEAWELFGLGVILGLCFFFGKCVENYRPDIILHLFQGKL